MEVKKSNVLTEMAIGVRQQFDLGGVALAMGSAGLSPKIKLDNPLEQRLISDIAVAGMNSEVRGRFDGENLAIQLISDTAGYVAHQQTKPISEDYHQSQKASRGAGQITQTTIEQQWESQLINDAELAAHTQLPSITFDVNNAYVSQQLGQRVGEEVSHFYHPTPPPRNPSGFWRGVDDVLKMREGTIKAAELIFTGRYEAPRDSWETVGFAIGAAPLALSSLAELDAERLGSAAINTLYQGSQQLGKGLIQASRLMNRWGLFKHNDTKEPLHLGNEANNHINALRLQRSFTIEQAQSIFDEAGGLLPEVIQTSTRLKIHPFANTELNEALFLRAGNLSDWRKYITEPVPSPSGNFRMHFYHNPITRDIYYGMDYKAVFNHEGSWSLPLSPNFEYEPPHFTL